MQGLCCLQSCNNYSFHCMDRSEEINIVNKFKFRLLTQANYALSQKQRQGTETLKYTLIEYPNTKTTVISKSQSRTRPFPNM